MNASKNFLKERPENSSMITVNILGRLRTATDQVRKVESKLAKHGQCQNRNLIVEQSEFVLKLCS